MEPSMSDFLEPYESIGAVIAFSEAELLSLGKDATAGDLKAALIQVSGLRTAALKALASPSPVRVDDAWRTARRFSPASSTDHFYCLTDMPTARITPSATIGGCATSLCPKWYQIHWGSTVRMIRTGETDISNTRMGFRKSVPFERLTGGRADLLAIDDPLSVKQADSVADRLAAERIMTESLPSRVNDTRTSIVAIIMQRVHSRDPAAIAIEQGYVHLNLPMEFEVARRCHTVVRPKIKMLAGPDGLFRDPRSFEGELLFPTRFPMGKIGQPATVANMKAKEYTAYAWADFKRMLSYKAIRHGGRYLEVEEAYTSRTCSRCGVIPASSPKGIGALGIREWTCSDCGAVHDRDVNAAENILRRGLATLDEGAARDAAKPTDGVVDALAALRPQVEKAHG
jgi:hypothetical protein